MVDGQTDKVNNGASKQKWEKDENNQKSQNLYLQFTYIKNNNSCHLWNDRHIKDEILDRLDDHYSEQYSLKKTALS